MERFVFDIPTARGSSRVIVDGSGECYAVQMDGSFIGTMWQDGGHGMQWVSEDRELQQRLLEISSAVESAFTKKGYPAVLMGAFDEIISADWTSGETLEVILAPQTDIDAFAGSLRQQAADLADFGEHVELIIRKQNEDYFKVIGVN